MDNEGGKGTVFIISAPSGTGKTTILKIIRELHPELNFSISHTTRPARKGEINGSDYHFVNKDQFKRMVDRGEFIEWAHVHHHCYGTARKTIDHFRQAGQDLILELDVQGAQSLRDIKFKGVYIFLVPPSIEELYNRLTKRGTETASRIKERIEVGKKELTHYSMYDYVVPNHNVEDTVKLILSIIRAERCRADKYRPNSKDIQSILKMRK